MVLNTPGDTFEIDCMDFVSFYFFVLKTKLVGHSFFRPMFECAIAEAVVAGKSRAYSLSLSLLFRDLKRLGDLFSSRDPALVYMYRKNVFQFAPCFYIQSETYDGVREGTNRPNVVRLS